MATVLATKVSIPYQSGMPWDKTENTFWFAVDGDVEEANITNIINGLARFYGDVEPIYSHSLADYYPFGVVDLEGATVSIWAVDIETGERLSVPVEFPLVFGASDVIGEFALPAEVALCLSFFSDHTLQPEVPQRRKRGRIYFGPVVGAIETYTIEGYMRPQEKFAITLLNGALALHDEMEGFDTAVGNHWVVYSRPVTVADVVEILEDQDSTTVGPRDGAVYPVTDAWVDDEWDTQRRRGKDPTGRWSQTL